MSKLKVLLFLGLTMNLVLTPIARSQAPSRSKAIELSPEAFQRLTSNQKIHRILLAQGEDPRKRMDEASRCEGEEGKKRCEEEEARRRSEQKASDVGTVDSDLGLHFGDSSGDAALIVFAVVGLVVVFAWIPYAPILLTQYLKNPDDFDTLNTLSLGTTLAPHNRSFYKGRTQYREGNLSGLKYNFLLRRKNELDENFRIGLAVEGGHYQLKLEDKDAPGRDFYGEYLLGGPSLMFGDKWFWLQLDLMGGTTFDSNIGLTTKADVTLNLPVSEDIFIAAGFGALYYDVKGGRGLASGDHDLGFTWTTRLGHQF